MVCGRKFPQGFNSYFRIMNVGKPTRNAVQHFVRVVIVCATDSAGHVFDRIGNFDLAHSCPLKPLEHI